MVSAGEEAGTALPESAGGFTGLPGGVGVSGLSVYDWPAADGVCGGTPHLHLVCSEAYVVTGGRGAVQTLTASGHEATRSCPGRWPGSRPAPSTGS